MKTQHRLTLPSWTISLPSTTRITEKEISSFFGYKSAGSVNTLVARGQFPKGGDLQLTSNFSSRSRGSKKLANYWFLGMLRDYEIKQNQESKS
jgi:hypothetical protein